MKIQFYINHANHLKLLLFLSVTKFYRYGNFNLENVIFLSSEQSSSKGLIQNFPVNTNNLSGAAILII